MNISVVDSVLKWERKLKAWVPLLFGTYCLKIIPEGNGKQGGTLLHPQKISHGALESEVSWEVALGFHLGDDCEWHKAEGWLLPLDSHMISFENNLGFNCTSETRLSFFFIFFSHKINLSSTSWITKTHFCLNTDMKYNSLSLLPSRNALQSTLDTIVKQAWFPLCVMFLIKSWNFLCIFLRKDYYISLPLFCNLRALLTPTPPTQRHSLIVLLLGWPPTPTKMRTRLVLCFVG